MVFRNLVLFFVGIGSKRLEIFKAQVKNKHGEVVSSGDDPRLTHVVIDESLILNSVNSRRIVLRECKELRNSVRYVSAKWLVMCLKEKSLLSVDDYVVFTDEFSGNEVGTEAKRRKTSEPSLETSQTSGSGVGNSKNRAPLCSEPSGRAQSLPGNAAIVTILQKLANAYRATKDTWRLYSYEKAISALEKCDKEIITYQEAVSIPGIGEKMASKIMEIRESGCLQKVAEVCESEEAQSLELFCQVWGAGPSTAQEWYRSGCRSLADLEHVKTLTHQQRIGLKYFTDFLERIPRTEVEEFLEVVKGAAEKVSINLSTSLVGSYRRGKNTCGDVDILIVNKSAMTANDVLVAVLARLKETGVVTDDLTSSEAGRQRKWFGVGQLQDSPRRRLDIFVVHEREEATALMHFTGSALFNRSIRMLASKKGMCLTEHGLYKNTVRRLGKGADVVHEGALVETLNEEEIFQHLGLEYRCPNERDH